MVLQRKPAYQLQFGVSLQLLPMQLLHLVRLQLEVRYQLLLLLHPE
jgi:hypothetical protein